MQQMTRQGDARPSGVGPSPKMREVLRDGVATVPGSSRLGSTPALAEESLVVDDRSRQSPAELVEHKLSRMLRDGSMPVSHLQMRRLLRAR